MSATFLLGFSCMRYQLYDYTRCGYYNGEHTVTGTVVSCVKKNSSFRVVLKDVNVDGKEEKGLLNADLAAAYANGTITYNVSNTNGYKYNGIVGYNAYFKYGVSDYNKYKQNVNRNYSIFYQLRFFYSHTLFFPILGV